MWGKDLLVVISDSGKLSLLTFCNEMHRFTTSLFFFSYSCPGEIKVGFCYLLDLIVERYKLKNIFSLIH